MKKSYDSKFKSRVALEAMRGELTIAEIASKYQIHPNQVQRWKQRLIEGASDIFASSSERKAEQKKPYTEDDLMKKIGRLEVENDFLQSVSLVLGDTFVNTSLAMKYCFKYWMVSTFCLTPRPCTTHCFRSLKKCISCFNRV